MRASSAVIASAPRPQASATVRTAPFITFCRAPSCTRMASVRRVDASKGVKETLVVAGAWSASFRVAIAAMNAGKDVLIEKPIAIDLKAADRMVSVARKTGRKLMVAQVLPFFPEFKFAAETIEIVGRQLGVI